MMAKAYFMQLWPLFIKLIIHVFDTKILFTYFCHISSTCVKNSMRLARLTWWHGDKIQAATFAQDKLPLGGANKVEYSCYILSQQLRKTWGEPVLGIPENYDKLTNESSCQRYLELIEWHKSK